MFQAGNEALAAGYIPEPPPIPEISQPVVPLDLNALGEPTLSSLGLCNYTPPGLFQYCLENLHVACDLPWWGAIAVGRLHYIIFIFGRNGLNFTDIGIHLKKKNFNE